LKIAQDLPDEAVITPARTADKTQMDALVVEENGALNICKKIS